MHSFTQDEISSAIALLLQDIPYKVCIGAEVEFYLQHDGSEDEQALINELSKHCKRIEKEKGWRQYEFVINHDFDSIALAQKIYDLRYLAIIEARKNSMKAMFDAKPFESDYGSALHFHISLHDEYNQNLFSDGEIFENDLLMKSINGILNIMDESLYLLCADNDDYKRFEPNFLAPTCTSWGGNNRTTGIRIPDSEKKFRRIEFRIPPANANPFWSVFVLLCGIHNGLNNNIQGMPRIYGNAFDPKYELKQFPSSVDDAKNIFLNEKKLVNYIDKYFLNKKSSNE